MSNEKIDSEEWWALGFNNAIDAPCKDGTYTAVGCVDTLLMGKNKNPNFDHEWFAGSLAGAMAREGHLK